MPTWDLGVRWFPQASGDSAGIKAATVQAWSIAAQGFDPVYGARPLRRYISHEVETRIGRALLGGDVRDGATVRVDAKGDELVVTYENPPGSGEAA